MWLCLPELCHGSKQQWHVDGGEEVRWTEGDWKKGSGNCTPLFLFFPPYLFCWTAAVLSHLSDRGEPLPGPKHVYLFLIPCLSPFSSYCSIILPWKLQPTHTHIYHLRTFAHIHTQAHSKTSGYAYYMSPSPLKASLLFSFCNLQQRWWGRSWFLHLRAVSSPYCRSCSLWLKRVCTAISNINMKFSNVFV